MYKTRNFHNISTNVNYQEIRNWLKEKQFYVGLFWDLDFLFEFCFSDRCIAGVAR
jgi:hypothetical protein